MSNLVTVTHARPGAKMHLYLATPAHTLHPNYLLGLVRSIPMLLEREISVTYALLSGHCHIDDARNLLVADFLQTKCTDLFFLDADVGWQPDAIARLARYDADVVGGAYPLKEDTGRFPVKLKDGSSLQIITGLIEVLGLPTGFLRIRRHVLEKMAKASDVLVMDGDEVPIIFERGVIDEGKRQRIGGDFNFCRKWRGMGGAVYLDPSILFTHQGSKDYIGCFANRNRTQQAAE